MSIYSNFAESDFGSCWRVSAALAALLLAATSYALPPNFNQETVVSGLYQPVNLQPLPDGRMLILDKDGQIRIFDTSQQPATPYIYLWITDVETNGERGLTSMALDPDFETNGYLYVYYTHGSTSRNRISRFTHTGDSASLASEVLIWEDNEDWSDCCHYGGGIGFGPDGKLYLTTGEEFDGAQAQDLTRAGGKIIRINKDGTIPADNPYADGPGGNLDEIWAVGLRNPYRAHWDLIDERFYIGEVGGNVQETAREDLHLGRAGANYGWPFCEGQCADPAYDDPIYDYGHTQSTPAGGAISAGFVYRGSQFPSSYNGAFFFGDYALSFIKYLTFNPDGSVASVNDFATNVGAPTGIVQGADGAMYVVDYYLGRVLRISYNSGNQPPQITGTTITPTDGAAPLDVDFSATATDPENDPLTYYWTFGDGSDAYGQNVSHTYTSSGAYDVVLEVLDGTQSTFSEPQTVQVGTPPTVSINAPVDGMFFRAGDTIVFSGTASDPDETIPATSYVWDVQFIHNAHTHPTVSQYVGTNGQFDINTSGHDYHDDTGYRLTLTVTDSDGLQGSDIIEIYPDKVDIRYETVPAGIPVFIDGVQAIAPFDYDTLIGFNHVIATPDTYCLGGQQYNFSGWSDGGAATHSIVVPTVNQTLTATFTAGGSCAAILPTSGLVTHLETDSGVSVTGGDLVTGWADQSGSGNNLTGGGDPRLLSGVLNGNPVIDFDGSGDKLERLSGVSGLPAGNLDRTVYLVANYNTGAYAGFAYGNSSCNQTFGTVAEPGGNLVVQGYCYQNDFNSGVAGTGTGWMVQSAVYASGQVSHYRDGNLIDTQVHNFNTVVNRMKVGAELNDNQFSDMEVAAVLVYNRELSASEQQQVQNYLQDKYFGTGGGNQAPVANDDSASVAQGGSVVVDVLSNDADPDGTLDPSSVTVVNDPINGTTSVNATTGAITYTHNGTSTTSDSFTYRVSDDGGLNSNVATVTVTISGGGGNQPPVTNPDSATVARGLSVTVDVLANDSDDGAIDPTSVQVMQIPADGVATVDNVTGAITYAHNGISLDADSLTYRVADTQGLYSVATTLSLTVREIDASVTITAPQQGGTVTSSDVTVQYQLDGTDYDHLHLSLDGNGHITIMNLTGSYTFQGVADGPHTIYASLVSAGHQPVNGPDSEDQVSFTVDTSAGAGLVTSGLVTHLETDSGVSVTGGDLVTGWADQSGSGNNLTGGGDPRLLSGVLNGNPVIDFDGSGDKLERLSGVSGLPAGNLDRTVYLVANYNTGAYAGFAYGNSSCNQTFGTVAEPGGNLVVQGYCYQNDFNSGVAGAGTGWMVQSAVYASGQVSHYRDGNLIDTQVHNFNTVVNRMKVGAELNDNQFSDMEVAAVLVYNRELSASEQQQVQNYLQDKYFGTGGGNQAPVANDDSASVAQGGSVVVDVLSNDADPDGTLYPSSVTVVNDPINGTTSVNAATGAITYTHNGTSTTSDSFTYRVSDNEGLISNVATVTVSISGGTTLITSGLVTHLESDSGVSVSGGDLVTGWADQSGLGNSLTGGGDPRLLSGVLNGHPVIDFDGTGDKLERLSGLSGLPAGNLDRTVYLVVNYNTGAYAGFAYGSPSCNRTFGTVAEPGGNLVVQGYCYQNDFNSGVAGAGTGWMVQSAVHASGQVSHYRDGNLIDTQVHNFNTVVNRMKVGAELNDNQFSDMQVAAVLVYGRALSAAERQQMQDYLQEKYFGGGP